MSTKDKQLSVDEQFMMTQPKLILCHSRYFKPILTHFDLAPIMENLGFVSYDVRSKAKPGPPSDTRGLHLDCVKFHYRATPKRRPEPFRESLPQITSETPPTPALPIKYIDGLHHQTYLAFIEAVNYYRGCTAEVVFHIQGIPANLDESELPLWRYVNECRAVVRLEALDPQVLNFNYIHSNFPAEEDLVMTMDEIDDIIVKSDKDEIDDIIVKSDQESL